MQGPSLVVASEVYSLAVVCRLLIVVASLVVGSEVVAHGLTCPEACGIFLDRIKLVSPALAGLTTGIPNHWTTREALIVFFTN